MAIATHKLTLEEFEAQYGQSDRSFEYWFGEAIPKGMATWVHGLLQKIVTALLDEQGFIAAPEIELRIESDAYPKPDVVATRKIPTGRYPTQGLDVVVEIISEDDKYPFVREKCRKYHSWGFGRIYLVDPSDRSVTEWKDGALIPSPELAGIPVDRIWKALDSQHSDS